MSGPIRLKVVYALANLSRCFEVKVLCLQMHDPALQNSGRHEVRTLSLELKDIRTRTEGSRCLIGGEASRARDNEDS